MDGELTMGRWLSTLHVAVIAIIAVAAVGAIVGLRGLNAGAAPVTAETSSAVAAGCETSTRAPEHLLVPIPLEVRRGNPGSPPILGTGEVLQDPESTAPDVLLPKTIPEGMTLQLALGSEEDRDLDGDAEWVVRLYYADKPISEAETLHEFYDRGGIVLTQRRTTGHDADAALGAFRETGRQPEPPVVSVGSYEAVLIHADPVLRNDLRPYHLVWSDGIRDSSLVGTADAAGLLNVGRSLYCTD